MFRPLADRVLIRPDAPVTETVSGLQLPDRRAPDQTGVIEAVGVEVSEVAIGDRVVFGPSSGQELWVNGGQDRYLVLRAADLLAVVEE